MAQLRLAMAQVNPVVGDLAGNARMIRDRVGEAAAAGAHLVAFPEMVLTAYPVEDLALRESLVPVSRASSDTGLGAAAIPVRGRGGAVVVGGAPRARGGRAARRPGGRRSR